MRRYDAIKTIVDCLRNEFVVACNGMISRELFAIKDRVQNFYMLGSMGQAPAIGLGIALANPNIKVVVILGDGNILMSLGTLATIGKTAPRNLMCIVLDNECHQSTGGQETSSSITQLANIASSSGIANSQYIDSLEDLKAAFVHMQQTGPGFIHAKVTKESVPVPRISIAPDTMTERSKSVLQSNTFVIS